MFFFSSPVALKNKKNLCHPKKSWNDATAISIGENFFQRPPCILWSCFISHIRLRKLGIMLFNSVDRNYCISGFVAHNETLNISIPTFPDTIPVISVNSWIVFQQRLDGTLDFNLTWSTYQTGFGNYATNFWMGLERIYQMTGVSSCRVRIEMLNNVHQWLSLEYDSFYLDSSAALYKLHITGYSGDLSVDPMVADSHNGMAFSTFDADHDARSYNCAATYGGGWWWHGCHAIALNGRYGSAPSGYPSFGYVDITTGSTTWHMLTVSRMMVKCNAWFQIALLHEWGTISLCHQAQICCIRQLVRSRIWSQILDFTIA